MRRHLLLLTWMIALAAVSSAQRGAARQANGPNYDAFYGLGPDSLPRDGVPKGEVRGPFTAPSKAIPGAQHTYWVYVPAQYDAAREVSLMVFNDGATYLKADGYYRANNVLDNLTYRGDIPVMIALFIDPGVIIDGGATNRSNEYDPLWDGTLAWSPMNCCRRCIRTTRFREIRSGMGSRVEFGAIAAFTVAWERPDVFHKVLNGIGTFVNLKGGHVYPEKILASEKKPLRIFMIDGRNDNRGLNDKGEYDPTRDWFSQNVQDGAGAHEEGLRRELFVGNRRTQPRYGRRHAARNDAVAMEGPARVGRPARRSRAMRSGRPRDRTSGLGDIEAATKQK